MDQVILDSEGSHGLLLAQELCQDGWAWHSPSILRQEDLQDLALPTNRKSFKVLEFNTPASKLPLASK